MGIFYFQESQYITTPGIYHNTDLGLISLSSDGTNWITITDKNFEASIVWDGETSGDNNSPFMGSFNFFGTNINMDNFHTPTVNELDNLKTIGIDIGAWTSSGGFVMTSLLRMPGYGYQLGDTGFRDYGNRYYWTSTSPYSNYGTYFKATNNDMSFVDQNVRDFGFKALIRPFANTPVQPEESWIVLYQPS